MILCRMSVGVTARAGMFVTFRSVWGFADVGRVSLRFDLVQLRGSVQLYGRLAGVNLE